MFSRRKRAQSSPPINKNPDPNAASAAAQAFLSSRASNASLSSAAAAAALKNNPFNEPPVSQVQTKRTVRRQASTSSYAGSTTGSIRGPGKGLQRANSSGSMTERTFRDPSPNRASISGPRPDAPPVPALPAGIPAIPKKSKRRAASVDPIPRVAPRVGSPPPKASGRGVSLDRGPASTAAPTSPSRIAAQRVTSLGSVQELERPDSRNSINFSYPKKSWTSPPASPTGGRRLASPLGDRAVSPLAISKNGLEPSEASFLESAVQDAANKPVKKKKKALSQNIAEGSHLAHGGMGGKPMGSAVDEGPPAPSQPAAGPAGQAGVVPIQAAPVKKKKKKATPPVQVQTATPPAASVPDGGAVEPPSPDRPRSYNTRAAGLLMKQPSVVHENRELEEAEEESDRAANFGTPPRGPSNQMRGPSSARAPAAKQHNRSASVPAPQYAPKAPQPSPASEQTTLGRGNGSIRGGRPQSLSPSRSTRFSSAPLLDTPEGMMHQPPPRSLSPAKSALKHSPSPRSESPLSTLGVGSGKGRGSTPSEASDNTSIMSEDGVKSAQKKKRNVRVSFDEDSVVVGRSASPPTSPDSPVVLSPQNKETGKKGWFNFGRGKKHDDPEEFDDTMKPRPALPSFGSVRSRKEQDDGDIQPEKVADTVPDNVADPAPVFTSSTGDRIEMSSDHALGSVIAQDVAEKTSPGNGHPVESVTEETVPSTTHDDDISDTTADESITSTEDTRRISPSTARFLQGISSETSGVSESAPAEHPAVPSIEVVQPTPTLEQSRDAWLHIPGGFPGIAPEDQNKAGANSDAVPSRVTESKGDGPSDGQALPPDTIVQGGTKPRQEDESEESDDSAGSIYSDAAEDLSDLEGDGFGSINAIIESPATKPTPGQAITTPPDSPAIQLQGRSEPLSQVDEGNESDLEAEKDWDKARAHWSSVNDQQKRVVEPTAAPPVQTVAATNTVAKPKKKKKKSTVNAGQPPLPPWPDQQYRESTRTEGPNLMKKSMRSPPAEAVPETQMRRTMRNGQMRSSMRGSPADSPRQSFDGQGRGRGTLQKQVPRPLSVAAASHANPGVKPGPRRALSNGSDSDSSFRKLRPSSAEGRYSLKQTMRGAPPIPSEQRPMSSDDPAVRSSRFSIRSLSPTGSSRRPFSPPGGGMSTMRPTMRGSIDSTSSAQKPRPMSPSRFPLFGKSKPKQPPSRGSRFSSRFGGGSSDEEPSRAQFSSRFADSSDDEDSVAPMKVPSNLTPVRGIPRKANDDGESTDLSDSSADESAVSPRAVAARAVDAPVIGRARADSREGSALAAGSLRQGISDQDIRDASFASPGREKKKKSIFGALGRRKDTSKVAKADMESAARRDTPLERSMAEIHAGKTTSANNSPRPPKLQRRITPQGINPSQGVVPDLWPLSPGSTVDGDDRPSTADGLPATSRPELGVRRSTLTTTIEGAPVSGRTGKKKKFPMLRRVFGIHD
ncbi:MAG: hypothetical protein M1819_004570 [Sarea resinae]|nr:MAG: hypothetical protein M1819_004570 [Sarea resinae]